MSLVNLDAPVPVPLHTLVATRNLVGGLQQVAAKITEHAVALERAVVMGAALLAQLEKVLVEVKLPPEVEAPGEEKPASMSYQPPWTHIGDLQQAVDEIRSHLHGKADTYEIHAALRRLDRVESSVRELGSEVDGLRARVQELEARELEGS